MRHIEIAKEAVQMITERVETIYNVQAESEKFALRTSDPGLAAGFRQAGKNRVAELKEEQNLLREIAKEKAKESIQSLPRYEQAEADKKVADVLLYGDDGSKNFWKSEPEVRAELSDVLNAIKNAPETLLEQQDKSDPAPVQGITMEEGHAVALDSLDQAVESHAMPPTEPADGQSPSDPSGDIERGIEQEQSRTEPPNQDTPGKDDR